MRELEDLGAAQHGGRDALVPGRGRLRSPLPSGGRSAPLRSEFYTAYTPYQPEVAQGTLQAIFEFQTIVSEILGLPVANASMYDGASAAAEAVLMARRLTGRERAVVSAGVHPHYRGTIETYVAGIGAGRASLADVPVGADGAEDLARAGGGDHRQARRASSSATPTSSAASPTCARSPRRRTGRARSW